MINTNPDYYSCGPMVDHGATLNFCKGSRSVGKTFDIVKYATDFCLANNKKFTYMRRYKPELTENKRKSFYLAHKRAGFYENMEYKINGDAFSLNGQEIGNFFILSQAVGNKSVPFPDTDIIIFDEYCIMPGAPSRYMQNEPILFMEALSTIMRRRNVRVFCIANNTSFNDPYSLFFDMRPSKNRFTWVKKPNGTDRVGSILLEIYRDERVEALLKDTALGRLAGGTRYEKFLLYNEPVGSNNAFIDPLKGCNLIFKFGIQFENNLIGFWATNDGRMVANRKTDPKSKRIYALTRDDHSLNTFLIVNANSTLLRQLKWYYSNACLFFDSEKTKFLCEKFLAFFIR